MCCRLWNKETFWRDWLKKKRSEFGGIGHYVARGAGICLPRGHPLACHTHVVSYPNITKHRGFYWKHKQISISSHLSRTRNILVEVFRDMFFRFYECISSAYQDKTYTAKSGALEVRKSTFFN